MLLIDRLAEERIQQARKQGELDNLANDGQPLTLDDDSHVPAHLRAAYRLLKNAGFVPPEIQWRCEIAEIESTLAQTNDKQNCDRVRKRLLLLRLQLERAGYQVSPLWAESAYRDRLLTRLTDG